MITRVYADNFRCLVNFEWKPGRLALLLGENGSGKTTVVEMVAALRTLITEQQPVRRTFHPGSRTRWESRLEQRFELDATVEGVSYAYSLVIEHHEHDATKSRLKSEDLVGDGTTLMSCRAGELHLFRDDGSPGPTIAADWTRSGLATIPPSKDNRRLTAFKRWLTEDVSFFAPNPRSMSDRTDDNETEGLRPDLTNIASWYPRWVASDLGSAVDAITSLKAVIPGLSGLQVSRSAPRLELHFAAANGTRSHVVGFEEASDGQRQLCALYAVRHAFLGAGRLAVFDEPDNYVALREIQPWLLEVIDLALVEGGPQVWFISHHPEILNQLAPNHGTRFFRQGGPVRVEPFRGVAGLTSAEVEARGWTDG